MKAIQIRGLFGDPSSFTNSDVHVAGWVKSARDMGDVAFVTVNDGSCFQDLQLVVSKDNACFNEARGLRAGSAIRAIGSLQLTPERPQPFELVVDSLELVGYVDDDYPIQKKRVGRDFLRTQQHLRPRTNLFRAVFRIRSVAAYALHTYFQQNNFVYVTTPIITTSDAEGAGEMFHVTTLDMSDVPKDDKGNVDYSKDFFGEAASLTVSGQLQAENFALAFGRAYTFGPTFRAENSNTRRHAAEFWMLEPEIAFCDLAGVMDVAQGMLQFAIAEVLEKCPAELEMLNKFVDPGLVERLQLVASSDFARVSYTQAIKILQDAQADFDFKPEWGADLQTEHERYLSEVHFGKPVFVYDYPADIKAFYMRENKAGVSGLGEIVEETPSATVAACDCLVPGIGEIIGGSQREERLDVLEARMDALGLDKEAYRYYLDLRRYGGCEHGGFGLGFERLVMYLTGIDNIRDVLPHPRTVGNAEF